MNPGKWHRRGVCWEPLLLAMRETGRLICTASASHLLPTTFYHLSPSPRRHKHGELFTVQTVQRGFAAENYSATDSTDGSTEISQGRRQTPGIQLLKVQGQPGPCPKLFFFYRLCLLTKQWSASGPEACLSTMLLVYALHGSGLYEVEV